MVGQVHRPVVGPQFLGGAAGHHESRRQGGAVPLRRAAATCSGSDRQRSRSKVTGHRSTDTAAEKDRDWNHGGGTGRPRGEKRESE